MPDIKSLNEITMPIQVVEPGVLGEEGVVLNVYANRRTRTHREQLREVLNKTTGSVEEAARETEKLQQEMAALLHLEELETKANELDALLESEGDTDRANELRAQISALEAQQVENQPQVEALKQKLFGLYESAENFVTDVLAEQLAFFVASTNFRHGSEPDSPLVEADAAFFKEHFDLRTLQDFSSKIMENLDGPLAHRVSLSSGSK